MTGLTRLTSAAILDEYSKDVYSVNASVSNSDMCKMFTAMVGRGPLGMLMRQDMAVQLHKDKRPTNAYSKEGVHFSRVPSEYEAFRKEFVFYKDEPLASIGEAVEFNEAIASHRLYRSVLNTRYAALLTDKLTSDSIRVAGGVEVVSDSSGQKFHFNGKDSCLVSTHHSGDGWYNGDVSPHPRYHHESEDLTVTSRCGFLTYEDVCLYIRAVSEYCHEAYTKYIEKRYSSLQSFTDRSSAVSRRLFTSVEKYIDLKLQQENIKLAKQGTADKSTPLSYTAIGSTISLQIDYSKSVKDVENHEWLRVEALDPEFVSLAHFSLNSIPKFLPSLKIKLVKIQDGAFKVTEIMQSVAEQVGPTVHTEEINILETGLYIHDAICRFESLAMKAKDGELKAYEINATNLLNPMSACAVMLHLPMFEALPEAVDKQAELVKKILSETEV